MHDRKDFSLQEDQDESGQRTSRKHPICNLKVQRGFAMRHLTRSPSRKWGTTLGLFLSATASQTLREKRRCPPSLLPSSSKDAQSQTARASGDRPLDRREREGRKATCRRNSALKGPKRVSGVFAREPTLRRSKRFSFRRRRHKSCRRLGASLSLSPRHFYRTAKRGRKSESGGGGNGGIWHHHTSVSPIHSTLIR